MDTTKTGAKLRRRLSVSNKRIADLIAAGNALTLHIPPTSPGCGCAACIAAIAALAAWRKLVGET